jgi:two-component system, OmpR family, copper resistance phosphate regulon response regulator CusR
VTRILVAEDDALVSSFIAKGLGAEGFTVDVVSDGISAAKACSTQPVDLVILDMALPGREGYEVLRELRGLGNPVPVLVLTGRPDLRDVVACLEVGADDYMIKPFRFEELLARIRARLRERGSGDARQLRVGRVTLDLGTRKATVGERTVDLTAREFALLETLMRHPKQVLSRQQLLSDGWGYAFDPGTNVVNVFISGLRRKLGSDVIETSRGMGYRFNG